MRDLALSFLACEHKTAKVVAYANYFLSGLTNFQPLKRSLLRRPTSALILLTTQCNMRCPDCFFREVIVKGERQPISVGLEEIKRIYEKAIFKTVGRAHTFRGGTNLVSGPAGNTRILPQQGYCQYTEQQ